MDPTPPDRTSGGGVPGRAPLVSTPAQPRRSDVPTDDSQIVRAVLAGDREAFRGLVDREAGSIIRACYRVLGDLDAAEDVAQDAFVTAYRSLGSWREDGPFGAWLARIAVRLAVKESTRRRSVPWIAPRRGNDDGLHDHMAGIPAERSGEPEMVAVRGERHRAVRSAVAGLDEPYREVVALRFFAERSLEEIAVLTGRPLGTVKTHLRRGLLRLRNQMPESDR